jgi:outer membrane autotransporter protein
MNRAELRTALLATSSAAALIFSLAQSAVAAPPPGCDQNNVSPPINNTVNSINCISFNNEQGGTANGNFTGATTFTGNVTNSGTINPTGTNNTFPNSVAGTDAGISVIGPGVKLVGNITNTGTITGTTAQFAGINIGGGGGGSGAPGSTVVGSILNATGATITGMPGIVVSGVGTVVTGSVTNQTGASIKTSSTAGGPGMSVSSHASVAGSLVNNGIIDTGGTGLLESAATIGGNFSNGGTITIHNGFTAMALVNGGSVGGSVINTGTVINGNAGTNIGLWAEGQTIAGGITNSGSVTGGFGLYVSGTSASAGIVGLNVSNGGTITALTHTGLAIAGATVTGSVVNSATINATAGVGLMLGTTTSHSTTLIGTVTGSIINSGTISAKTGIKIAGGATAVGGITNSGSITGSGGTAIDVTGDGTATAINQTGGTVTGNILLSGNGDTVNQTGGTIIGSIVGKSGTGFVNFTLGAGSQTFGPTTNVTNVGLITLASGTVVLDGTSNEDTATRINGGTLMVGDATHATATFTDKPSGGISLAGGTLDGYGTIIGNVTNTGGTVQGGGTLGTIGVLHVTGNYKQTAGTYAVEINPTTGSQLSVSGTASLGGNVNVVYDPGTYSAKSYDILHAATVANTFAGLTGSPPSGVTSTLNYTTTDVNLALAGSSGGGGGGTVTTPTGVLGDVTDLGLAGFFDSDDEIFDHLDEYGQSSDGVKTALAAAAPMQIAMNGSLEQVAQLGSAMPNMLAQYGGWVRGIGDFQSADSQGTVPGYSASGGGFLAGIDHAFGPLTAGLAAGYSGTNFKQQDGSTGDIQTPRVMAYARYHATPQIVIDGIAGFAYDSIHTSRPIAPLNSNAVESHSGTEENLALQAGYMMPVDGFTLIPRVGAQYVHLSQNGFSESGASGFDLTAPSSHIDSFQPVISISALRAFDVSGMRVTPEVKLAYSHELLNTAQTLALTTPAGSVVPGTILTPARNTLTVGPEVTAQMNQQLSLYADYKAVIGIGKSLDNVIFAGARINW